MLEKCPFFFYCHHQSSSRLPCQFVPPDSRLICHISIQQKNTSTFTILPKLESNKSSLHPNQRPLERLFVLCGILLFFPAPALWNFCLLFASKTKRPNTLIDLIERVVREAIFIMHKLREFFDPEGIHPMSKLKPHVRPQFRSIPWTETLKYSCTAHIISHYLPETIKPSHFQGSLPGMQLPAVVRNHYPKHRKIFHLGTFSVCLWQGEEGMEMTKAQSKH